jgi:23S rRNA (uracil1939-C5)-methyltransferase
MDYEYQLCLKQAAVEELFSELSHTQEVLRPIIGSKEPWGYRNKMEFTFSQDKQGKRFLGLFGRRHKRDVIDISACSLAPEWMSIALSAIRNWWRETQLQAYRSHENSGTLLTVTFREGVFTDDRMVILTVSGVPEYAPQKEDLDSFVRTVKEATKGNRGEVSIILRVRQIAKKMPTQIFEMILLGPDHIREVLHVATSPPRQLEFHVSPQAFFQPNTVQAEKIYTQALRAMNLSSQDVVWDLYCGIGIFGMFAAEDAREVMGVEISKDAAYDAKMNSRRLGMGNFTVHCGDVATVIATLRSEGKQVTPSVVIVDPPRSGLLPKAHEELALLNPQRIVYVSCNPRSQAVDAKRLQESGWRISGIQPVDQFPHTPHAENIVVFTREGYGCS